MTDTRPDAPIRSPWSEPLQAAWPPSLKDSNRVFGRRGGVVFWLLARTRMPAGSLREALFAPTYRAFSEHWQHDQEFRANIHADVKRIIAEARLKAEARKLSAND